MVRWPCFVASCIFPLFLEWRCCHFASGWLESVVATVHTAVLLFAYRVVLLLCASPPRMLTCGSTIASQTEIQKVVQPGILLVARLSCEIVEAVVTVVLVGSQLAVVVLVDAVVAVPVVRSA